ncbi:MAG: hypothetical protein A2Y29_05720, partial [Spirochaetes bacterium GWE2_31_10]
MKKTSFLPLFSFLLIISTITNCAIVKQMLPAVKESKTGVSPLSIEEEVIKNTNVQLEIFSVAGYNEPHTPPLQKPTRRLEDFLLRTHGTIDLNRSLVYKYYNPEFQSTTIQVMVAGIHSGVGTIANLAEAIVLRSPETEVWIWERRSNLLEDRSLFIETLQTKNTSRLLESLEPDTYKPKADIIFTPTTDDISFAGFWGFNVFAGDLFNVINKAKSLEKKVILSGYSLGVMYVTNFLANLFTTDGVAEPGYSLVDGAVLYDGPSQIDAYVTSENKYKKGIYIFPPGNFIHGINELETGKIYPCNTDGTGAIDPFFKIETKAILAAIAPDDIAPIRYTSGFQSFNISNLASALVEVDDNYHPFKLFTATLGRADANHFGVFSKKSVVSITGYSNNKIHIDWIYPEHFPGEEFNDIPQFLYTVSNKTFNSSDWYQPTRILLDLGSIHKNDTSRGWQKSYFSVSENSKINIPMLAIGLTKGL